MVFYFGWIAGSLAQIGKKYVSLRVLPLVLRNSQSPASCEIYVLLSALFASSALKKLSKILKIYEVSRQPFTAFFFVFAYTFCSFRSNVVRSKIIW